MAPQPLAYYCIRVVKLTFLVINFPLGSIQSFEIYYSMSPHIWASENCHGYPRNSELFSMPQEHPNLDDRHFLD